MPIVNIPNVYLRMGIKRFEETFRDELLPDQTVLSSSDYALVVYWPRAYSWLGLDISALTPANTVDCPFVSASDNEAAFDGVFSRVGTNRTSMILRNNPNFFAENEARCAFVKRTNSIQLRFGIRTDAKGLSDFARLERQREIPSDTLRLKLKGLAFDFRPNSPQITRFDVDVHLAPLQPIHYFRGCVALDLGSFSSSVAAIHAGRTRSSDIRVLESQPDLYTLKQNAETMDSLVRLDRVRSWYPNRADSEKATVRIFPSPQIREDDYPDAVEWVAGKPASDGELSRQLPGAKRLLASFDPEKYRPMPVEHVRNFNQERSRNVSIENLSIRNRLPAELLATRLIQNFLKATESGNMTEVNDVPAGWPLFLAVTYPTSYSPREIFQLRTAIYRSWLRAMSQPQTPPAQSPNSETEVEQKRDSIAAKLQSYLARDLRNSEPYSPDQDPLIRMMIDEATAASFYYLFRFSAESPGGLAAFRYKYPKGMNLLLYDCGGGTTDIALVQGCVDVSKGDQLVVTVLGRSGVRHFGGDDITIAVCKILKAKLIAFIARQIDRPDPGRNIPPPPKAPTATESGAKMLEGAKEMERFLNDIAQFDPTDKFVSTKFNPLDMGNATSGRRRYALTLWGWGEELKKKIGVLIKGEPVRSVKLGEIGQTFDPPLGGLYKAIFDAINPTMNANKVAEIRETISKIEIHRWEVDGLIARQVARSIACCRNLIVKKLPGETGASPVVHKVVVTGNAARYPLIQEMLKTRLDISDLPVENWYHFEEKELKNAVAKGAVRALSARTSQGQTGFHFDTNLSECLPYDIAYRDWSQGSFPRLYHQQELYSLMGEKTVKMAALRRESASPTQKLQNFTLLRRFPGDGDEVALEDEQLPAFDAEDEMKELRELRGYTRFETYHFKDGITGDLKIRYSKEVHEFEVEDVNGNRGERQPDQSMELRTLAPYQRGNL